MGLLDRFLGSDKNLRGPDFDKAPWLELDFSDNKLRFKDPEHTAEYPVEVSAESMNIYDKNNYSRQKHGHFIRNFYSKGFNLTGLVGKAKGGIDILGRCFYFEEKEANCFKKQMFERKIIEFCHRSWHKQNDEEYVGASVTDFSYPTDVKHLAYKIINTMSWCNFQAKRIGKPPTIEFATSISSKHILIMTFTLSGYDSVDFYSPATNLEQASYKLVDDFMNNFYIELSKEAKTQKAAAEGSI